MKNHFRWTTNGVLQAFNSQPLLLLLMILICQFHFSISMPNSVISTDTHSLHISNFGRSSLKTFRAKCMEVSDEERFDCHPDAPYSESECISRGCCWMPAHNPSHAQSGYPPVGVPYCFFPKPYSGYNILQAEQSRDQTTLTLKRMIASGYIHEVPVVKVQIISINTHQIRVRIFSATERRFEVPIPLNVTLENHVEDALYEYQIEDGQLIIRRKETHQMIWSANLNTLVFSDQLIQINTKIASDVVYGLGEHKDEFRKTLHSWKRYTFFSWDQPPSHNVPLYGVHPMYLSLERNNPASVRAHSVFLLNSNALEAILQPKNAITWRTIGGILDFFINFGPTIDEAIQQHVSLVGRPQIPPYWSLGFHLCRYGYKTLENTRAAYERMRKAEIPFDTQWHDIDFMKDYNDFTYDKEQFAGLPEFVQELHDNGMKYIPMFDPGLGGNHSEEEYPIFYEGLKQDIYIKNVSGNVLRAKVWNVHWTAWIDFTNPRAVNFWVKQFHRFHREIPFDGAWIDMNEPSSLYDGSMDGCPWESRFESPQYVPGAISPLAKRTACMTAIHHLGMHYDLHNLYGYYEAIATDKAMRSLGKRPFIVSRSTFAGQGQFSAHWTGDDFSTWEDLKMSIHNMLDFNLFGIPMVGADICGFLGHVNPELCARWQSLGAFYPFSRNHNEDRTPDQDPPVMGEVVVAATLYSLRIRYSLLPLLYTEFYKASQTGQPVIRSLFLEFPHDSAAELVDTQFLWGHSVMIAPVVEHGVRSLYAYFPAGRWYRYDNHELLSAIAESHIHGHRVFLQVPLTEIVVAVRGGSILATQKPEVTTKATRAHPFRLLVALNEHQTAIGDLYWDQGESIDPILNGDYNYVKFNFEENVLTTVVESDGYEQQPPVGSVEIVGLNQEPSKVVFNDQSVAFDYDSTKQLLTVTELSASLIQRFELRLTYDTTTPIVEYSPGTEIPAV